MRGLLYLVVAFVLAGCAGTGSQIHALDEAQQMLTDSPREAFDCLNAMDVSEFTDSATLARWALLYGQAMAANRLYAPTDTIIDIAIDYYRAHALDDELIQAQSLKAKLSAPSGRDADALTIALYRQKEKEFYLYRERVARERVVGYGVILLLIAAGVIVWQRQRLKIGRMRTAEMMAEVSGLRSQVLIRQQDCSNMETALGGLLKRRFELIDSLCQTFYESQGTKTERKAVADRVRAEIEAVRSDETMIAEMERTVNDCRSDLLAHLKSEYSDIKPDDYRLAVYLACGFSYRTISLLTGDSIDNLYKRKSRLKLRIKNLAIPHEAEISAIF